MHVLVAATDSHLDYARAEASNWAAAQNLIVSFVPAPVTAVSVTRALQQADDIELAVFIGHGGVQGIELDKGELLDYATLAPFVRGRIPALFINTCDSEPIAEAIAHDCGAAVICTIGPIDDRHAYAVGSMLAYWLDTGHTFEEAAQLALPCADPVTKRWSDGVRGFKYIPAPAQPTDGGRFRCTARSFMVAV